MEEAVFVGKVGCTHMKLVCILSNDSQVDCQLIQIPRDPSSLIHLDFQAYLELLKN